MHASQTIAALDAGKHVLSEKPVATTEQDCARMIDVAKRTGRILFIDHELRYSSLFRKITQLIKDGQIGAPKFMWCKEFRSPLLNKTDQWILD